MKTTNHTPGPWKHDEAWGLIKYGKTEICALHSGNEANAHLIAAAPKLLQVLKDLLPEFVDLYERFDPTGEIAVWDQWTQEALEVIAEAEGVA